MTEIVSLSVENSQVVFYFIAQDNFRENVLVYNSDVVFTLSQPFLIFLSSVFRNLI